jgi:hypothetical protein
MNTPPNRSTEPTTDAAMMSPTDFIYNVSMHQPTMPTRSLSVSRPPEPLREQPTAANPTTVTADLVNPSGGAPVSRRRRLSPIEPQPLVSGIPPPPPPNAAADRPVVYPLPFQMTPSDMAEFLFRRHEESVASLRCGLVSPTSPNTPLTVVEELSLYYTVAGEQRLATAILQLMDVGEGLSASRGSLLLKMIRALAQTALERPP